MKRIIKIIASVSVVCMMANCIGLAYSDQQKIKDTTHEIAELARDMGLDENDAIIQRAQELWWKAHNESLNVKSYTDEDLLILTNVIHYEACSCPQWHKELVGQVVCNRVADSRFPNTIRGVVAQPGQYSALYVATAIYCQNCKAVARNVLEGRVDCPQNVIYQANFRQGTGVYRISYVDTGWFRSTTYFCYG